MDKATYLTIADGMGASLDNGDFIERFANEYRVVRAHMPSRKPLVSRLIIRGDNDNTVIRFTHHHVVSDALSLFDDPKALETNNGSDVKNDESPNVLSYEGFVFNCERRAFLLSTSIMTKHVKEMILHMPASGSHISFKGLLLTVSADDREPFAARVLVQKLPKILTDEQREFWKPGLKQWADLPMLEREFNAESNFGILQIHSPTS